MNGNDSSTLEARPTHREVVAFFCPKEPGYRFRTKEGLEFQVEKKLTPAEAKQADRQLYDQIERNFRSVDMLYWLECQLVNPNQNPQ